jgi:thiol:disulfide interchange protein
MFGTTFWNIWTERCLTKRGILCKSIWDLQYHSAEDELLRRHYVFLRADWTRYDPEVTSELSRIGRSGVPTYGITSGSNKETTRRLSIETRLSDRDAAAKMIPAKESSPRLQVRIAPPFLQLVDSR